MLKLRLAVSASMACRIGLCSLSYRPLRPVVWNHTLRQSLLIICSFFHFSLFILSFFIFHFSFFIPSCSFLFPAAKIQQKGSFVNTFCRNTYSALIINQLTSYSFPRRKELPGLCCAWAGSLSQKVYMQNPLVKKTAQKFGGSAEKAYLCSSFSEYTSCALIISLLMNRSLPR